MTCVTDAPGRRGSNHCVATRLVHDADSLCAALFSVQYGVIHRLQAIERGLSPRAIENRLRSGRWERILPGVYGLRGAPPSWRKALMAACLWAGGVVSHRAAAKLWGFDGIDDEVLEITTTTRKRRRGVIVHEVASFERLDLKRTQRFVVTSPTRTLIDLAGVVDARTLEIALDRALHRSQTHIPLLQRQIDSLGTQGRRGLRLLHRVVADRAAGGRPTESGLEVDAKAFIERHGSDPPERQYWLRGINGERRRLDFAWPALKVGVEADSREWHGTLEALESDVVRNNFYVELDWRVLRLTLKGLRTNERGLADQLWNMIGQAKLRNPDRRS